MDPPRRHHRRSSRAAAAVPAPSSTQWWWPPASARALGGTALQLLRGLLQAYLALTLGVLAVGLLAAVADVPYFVDPVTGAHVNVFVRLVAALEPHAEALEASWSAAWARPDEPALKQWLLGAVAYAAKAVRATLALKRYGPALGPMGSAGAAGSGNATTMLDTVRAAEVWVGATLVAAVQAVLGAYTQARDAAVEAVLSLARAWVPAPFWPAVAVAAMLGAALAALAALGALGCRRAGRATVARDATPAAPDDDSSSSSDNTASEVGGGTATAADVS